MSTEIPKTFQAPLLPGTDISSKFYTNIQEMCADLAAMLSEFYHPKLHAGMSSGQIEEGSVLAVAAQKPICYVYADFGMSHGETLMFGVVCKGVENFNDETFRARLEAHLIKEIGLAVSIPRKDWGRIVSDLANPNNNMWLFHIAIPAEYTSVKLGFIE